eukprot:TRINITY_DN13953_c0_g1_i1.p1 TRINITY_DN13953_c0_g1~~TRINITY_DN13953_c0_g1_i1.p1  ORF type:complete len:224 (+),score=36.26 TRINITY_DN13953_c0_g1_i1:206-877(+)
MAIVPASTSLVPMQLQQQQQQQQQRAPRAKTTAPRQTNRKHWMEGWEANPVMSSSPRWTFGKALLDTPNFGAHGRTDPANSGIRKTRAKLRETFVDDLLRLEEDQGTGEKLGPGSHNPLPVDRVFQQPEEDFHGHKAQSSRAHGSGGFIDCSRRPANYTSLRQYRRTELPTSFHTPGPGSYTQHTSFGSASGPSRVHYLPKPNNAEATRGSISAFPARTFTHT